MSVYILSVNASPGALLHIAGAVPLCQQHACQCRLGEIDSRQTYHTETQLWPIKFLSRAGVPEDPTHSKLLNKILPGGEEGPLFTVSTKISLGTSSEETVVSLDS